jgi:ABC-type lipoprotein release transport system permease subunit
MYDIRTMEQRLGQSMWLRRAYSWLFGVFSAVALLLAVGGIYGVVSYTVGQRRREIGIRMALGAERRQIQGLVLRQGMRMAGLGMAIGLAAAWWASRWLESLLFGVSARDVVTYAAQSSLPGPVGQACCLPKEGQLLGPVGTGTVTAFPRPRSSANAWKRAR